MKANVMLIAMVVVMVGCSGMRVRSPTATATLAPTKGNQVGGRIAFTQSANGVLLEARLTGLTPGRHGFHIHERGDCTGDASAAGDHFNPHGSGHGAVFSDYRHAGDLGNIDADASGVATYRATITGVSLGAGRDSIIGRSVIVHEKADDLRSQPGGDSGARQACGLISKTPDKWF